jgi:hypothetical protein
MTTMTQTQETATNKTISQPRIFAHVNGLALFVGSIVAYGIFSGDWLAFIILLLVPDVSMIGYMLNTTIGAWLYNIVHSYALAIVAMMIGYAIGVDAVISIGLILMAHVGMDQAVGYGYKYAEEEFSDTHFNRI